MSSRVNVRPAARHRARRRRLGALGGSIALTLVAGAAAVGDLPQPQPAPAAATMAGTSSLEQASLAALSQPVTEVIAAQNAEAADDLVKKSQKIARIKESEALPPNSGKGRRIVYSETAQRVWLVERGGIVERTYLVSGSKYDNLNPGKYFVQSRTRHATAFDYSGTMEYFVRFATGYTAPIGFHTVPVDHVGRFEQTEEQLGTPTSAGCVRQWYDDALALWNFAPVGTKVIVTR